MTALPYHRYKGPGDFEPADTDDRVAELTKQLVDERMNDPVRIAAEIDEIAGTSDHNSDGNTQFAADMALVLDSSDVAFEAHAVAFFQQLREKVRASMERDASTDAAAQVAKDDDDAAEMRDMYRARNAA